MAFTRRRRQSKIERLSPLGVLASVSASFRRCFGSEFANDDKPQRDLAMQIYSCDPHSSWQRGSIENTNGVRRRDLPRKTELKDYSHQDINDIVWAINTTPRKMPRLSLAS